MASLPLAVRACPTAPAWPAFHRDASAKRPSEPETRTRRAVIVSDDTAMVSVARPAPEGIGRTFERRSPFTGLEAMAVRIGMDDPLPFLDQGGRLARLGRRLFGSSPPNPLADPHLEALRTIVMTMRRRGNLPQGMIDAALAAGITRAQLDRVASDLYPSGPS